MASPDPETTIVPLDEAHVVLEAMGIGGDSRGYRRWRCADGFRLVDLVGVLCEESPNALGCDWRGALADAIESIVAQLAALGIEAACEPLGDDGDEAILTVGGASARLHRGASEEGVAWDEVIAAVNERIGPEARYRRFRSSEGADTAWYALLPADGWERLGRETPGATALLFAEIGTT